MLPCSWEKTVTPAVDDALFGVVTETFRGAEKEGRKSSEEAAEGPEFVGGDFIGRGVGNEGE
jgi:hypothetical protein